MKYWLLITTRENGAILQEKNIYGISEKKRNIISQTNIGDQILVYLKRERNTTGLIPPVIVGLYQIQSDIFKDQSLVFIPPITDPDEKFPLRIKISPIRIFTTPIKFKPLISKLNFITNKNNWASHLQGHPIREIPKEDFNFIVSSAKD